MRSAKQLLLIALSVMSVLYTNAQNVGIGTTTPTNLFQIGNVPSTISDNNFAIGNGAQGMSFNQLGSLSLWSSNTNISLSPSSGLVGINKIIPVYTMDIMGLGNAQLNLTESNGGRTALFSRYTNRLEIQPSDAFEISIGAVDQRNLCVASNGDVGIGTATPANILQVGTYTNANFSGNQFALGYGSNVTVLNQYPSYFNMQSSTAMYLQSTSNIYLMPDYGAGFVGINTNAPVAPLDVENPVVNFSPSGGFPNGGFGYYTISGSSTTNTGFCGSANCVAPVTIYTNYDIMAQEFDAISDARVKDIEDISNSAKDLQTLNTIQVTNYTMKDKMKDGNKQFKKIIAQQVEEVYPQVVNKNVNYIPNVYQLTDKVEKTANGYLLSFKTPHHLDKDAKKLQLIDKAGTQQRYNIISIPSDKEVLIKAPDLKSDTLFVYGEQVNDFRTVDYDGLTTLNISATQELSKLVKQQQDEIDMLISEVNELKTKH